MYLSNRTICVRLDNIQWLLFNTLSGALDIIDKDLANNLRQKRWSVISPEIKKSLLERGYLFESHKKEVSEFLKLCEVIRERESKLAPEFVVIPTYQCNLRCQYCYEGNLQYKGSLLNGKLLSLLWHAMDEITSSYIYEETPKLTLLGGEPLLKPNYDIIANILGGCFQRRWTVEITTNGTTLTRYASLLSRYQVKGIQVTLDGTRDIHDQRRAFPSGKGSFDQILEGITSSIRKGIKVYLRVNLDSQNLDYLPSLAIFIQEKGWLESGLVFPYLYPMSDSGCLRQLHIVKEAKLLGKVIELSKKYPEMNVFQWKFHGIDQIEAVLHGKTFSPMFRFCSATKNQYVFDPLGKIYACWWGVGNKQFEIGVFAPKLRWYQDNLDKWRHRDVLTISRCSQCKFALICGGGCTEKAIREEGGIDQPRCSSFSEIISLAAPFLIKQQQL